MAPKLLTVCCRWDSALGVGSIKITFELYLFINSISNEKIKFYKPKEKEFVSHSISNWENNYSEDTDFIEVETISISEIVKRYNLSNVPLLKLDIEGAENIVIPDMLDKKIFPEQILVEFDEIHGPYFKAYKSAFFVFFKLLINGYKLITTPMFPDFLFVKKNIIT